MLRFWSFVSLLGAAGSSLSLDTVEAEGNNAENYDNEIYEDQQEGDPLPSPSHADFSRWDKLFIALENSHMRQIMLLEAVQQCGGGVASLRNQVDDLAKGGCRLCTSSPVSDCRVQVEEVNTTLHRGLTELQREEAEREERINATLQMILGRCEESAKPRGPQEAESMMGNPVTPRPGSLGVAFSSGVKPFASAQKEQEVMSTMDMASMERALVAIATELQKVHLQLSRVIQQAGTLRKDKA
ncbi:hypothetical protein OJAV_G00216520 [Oryzias javanicus]|uniref:Pentraxin 3, long b n=1 Tax=Oryzias javanicus TaxID=123683 RepID=A0A3S2TX46_ORYJA|nr:hypothetical protein OJAV_G00216520 [Oryzias javanicus]